MTLGLRSGKGIRDDLALIKRNNIISLSKAFIIIIIIIIIIIDHRSPLVSRSSVHSKETRSGCLKCCLSVFIRWFVSSKLFSLPK